MLSLFLFDLLFRHRCVCVCVCYDVFRLEAFAGCVVPMPLVSCVGMEPRCNTACKIASVIGVFIS